MFSIATATCAAATPSIMQQLALDELTKHGYAEDLASRRIFERRHHWFAALGVLLCIGPYPLTRFIWSPCIDSTAHFFSLVFCFLLGLALCFGAKIHVGNSVPVSRMSGIPMQVFLLAGAPADTTEYLYVDHRSRTYFTRAIGSIASMQSCTAPFPNNLNI